MNTDISFFPGKRRSTTSERHAPLVVLIVLAWIACATPGWAAPRAIVLDGAGPWRDARWTLGVTEFTKLLTDAGYQVNTVSPVDLISTSLTADVLLAVPSFESLPLACYKAVTAFLAAGGSLMASGGEPFRDPLYMTTDGTWVGQNSLLQALTPGKTVLDPAAANLSQIFYVQQPVTRTTVTGPDGQSKALDFQLQMPATTQYFLLTAPLVKPVFDAGQTLTMVWTRGTPGQSMLFEWDEADGSRWIATVPLTSQWTKQVLFPADFHYWPSVPARAGTTFNPVQATQLYFGVSTGQNALPGPLEFALSAIGTAKSPGELFSAPVLETLSPWYKQYVTQRSGQTVRVPVTRGRGLSATPDPDGRFRAIGDLLAPAATWYAANSGATVTWLPWPQLQGQDRAQLVALLSAAASHLYIMNAGPAQIVVLPNEKVTLGARIRNSTNSPTQASLVWSISDGTGAGVARFTSSLSLAPAQIATAPTTAVGQLPPGDYTVTAGLVAANREVDRLESRVRVFAPTSRFQPDQRIVAAGGSFATASGRSLFLQGVNYWPRYTAGLENARFYDYWQSWLLPQNYDPDVVEADLALLASLHFNLVSIQYGLGDTARSLVDFLDRCRSHGLWANIYFDAFTPGTPMAVLYAGQVERINPNIASLLQAAFLPGNDRVFAYDLLWEANLGAHADRLPLDGAWRTWITDQYGSAANAEKSWGFTAPRDAQGQLSNPLDTQIATDGAWRVMVAAYRRFLDDFLGRAFGAATRAIRATAPDTLLSFRNGLGGWTAANNASMGYDLGVGAAHVDFVSSEAYGIPVDWPDGRIYGFGSAYGRYRTGAKPVYWAEYGYSIGANPTAASRARQISNCDTMMRLVNEDGSGAASVWWMPGGWRVGEQSDYGILEPDGSPRDSANVLAQWGARFTATPPSQGSGAPVNLVVDRDADARGQYGLFLRWQNDYAQARQAGHPVVLVDAGTDTDTATMPLVQVGNVPYAGSGPLKYANAEFAGIRVQCPGLDVKIENGAQVQAPSGSTCRITLTVINTGSATWLPTASSKGGVVLHTNAGDLPLLGSLGYLQRTDLGPLQIRPAGSSISIAGRLSIQGVGPFGETLQIGSATGPKASVDVSVASGGAGTSATFGSPGLVQAGFAAVSTKSGAAPYGTAVFSFKQNGVTVSEAGVPGSPPTTSARIFIDYRSGVAAVPGRSDTGSIDINTGIAVVNYGSATANVLYTLRSTTGATLVTGHGTIAAGTHFAKFVNQLQDVAPDFILPSDFPTATRFASLEIAGDQPLSILALRGTTNQRNEFLLTTTPVANLAPPPAGSQIYFPQFVDGGGYTTTLILLNTSDQTESGTLTILDDQGLTLIVNQLGGTADSYFKYSIPPGGIFRFQSDGSPATTRAGWALLTADAGTSTPAGAGVFSYNPGSVLITESGIPAAVSTTHARVYVDLSGNHDTGLAIANPSNTDTSITIRAFQSDGVTGAGAGPATLQLLRYGHSARFADQLITGLPAGFTGVLDIASATPFAALTIRSRVNERNEFLLTTFPIADQNRAPSPPIVFPQIADGGGFVTQFILLSAGGASSDLLTFYDDTGTPWTVGK